MVVVWLRSNILVLLLAASEGDGQLIGSISSKLLVVTW
jgi:hypothetical protein